jgi:DNA-binding PadR family transcriptional regulator
MSEAAETLTDIKQRFARDFLDVVVLRLIQVKPRWGYEIMAEIKNTFQIKAGASKIYPLLNSLEANGFIKSRWKYEGRKRKKLYGITPQGVKFLESVYNFLKEQVSMHELHKRILV